MRKQNIEASESRSCDTMCVSYDPFQKCFTFAHLPKYHLSRYYDLLECGLKQSVYNHPFLTFAKLDMLVKYNLFSDFYLMDIEWCTSN